MSSAISEFIDISSSYLDSSLSFTQLLFLHDVLCISEKVKATHSSTLAWKIPWMEDPGRLQSMGSLRVGLHFHFSLSCTEGGNGNPLQCSCLENPRDRGAWWAAIYGVAQSWTRLKQLSSSSSNSAYKLNKQGDNIQPWHTPFPILNQSIVPCPVLIGCSVSPLFLFHSFLIYHFVSWFSLIFFSVSFSCFWLWWVFVAELWLSLVWLVGATLCCGVWTLIWWSLMLQGTDYRCAGFSSCSVWTQ